MKIKGYPASLFTRTPWLISETGPSSSADLLNPSGFDEELKLYKRISIIEISWNFRRIPWNGKSHIRHYTRGHISRVTPSRL